MTGKESKNFLQLSKPRHASYQMGVHELPSKDLHTGFSVSMIYHSFKYMSLSELFFFLFLPFGFQKHILTWQDKGWLQGSIKSLSKASYSLVPKALLCLPSSPRPSPWQQTHWQYVQRTHHMQDLSKPELESRLCHFLLYFQVSLFLSWPCP